jgi:hypothetical protein
MYIVRLHLGGQKMSEFEPDEDLIALYASTSAQSLDALFGRLGELDPDLPVGAAPFDPAFYVEAGKAWWTRNRALVRSYACCNAAIQRAAANAGSNLVQAAFLLLAQHFGSPLATYAAVLFVKEAAGDALDEAVLRRFREWCGEDWRVQKSDEPSGRGE